MVTLVDLDIPKKYNYKIDMDSLRSLQEFSVAKPPAPQTKKTSLKVLHDMHFDPLAVFTHIELEGDFSLAFAHALKKLLKRSPDIPEIKIIINNYEKKTITQSDSAHQVFEKLHA